MSDEGVVFVYDWAPTDPNIRQHMAADLERVVTAEVNEKLQQAADKIIAELVCCDVYDRLHAKPVHRWTDQDRSDYRHHSLCYWGEASARIVWGEMT